MQKVIDMHTIENLFFIAFNVENTRVKVKIYFDADATANSAEIDIIFK